MCDPVSASLTAMQAFQSVQRGQYANAQAGLQASQEDFQAGLERDSAQKTAALIRRAGTRQVGQANAAYAAAGVKVGEGSALETERYIDQGTEHDAFQTILQGDRRARALQTDATMTRIGGHMAEVAGQVGAVGTVLQGGYNAMRASGWRTAGPGFSGTQAPAPVETITPGLRGNSTAYWKS